MNLIKTSMSFKWLENLIDLSSTSTGVQGRFSLRSIFKSWISKKNLALKRQIFWNSPCNCLMRQFPIVPAAAVYVHNQLFCFWRSNALIHCHNGVKVFMKSYLHFFFQFLKIFFLPFQDVYFLINPKCETKHVRFEIFTKKKSIRLQKFCGPIMH